MPHRSPRSKSAVGHPRTRARQAAVPRTRIDALWSQFGGPALSAIAQRRASPWFSRASKRFSNTMSDSISSRTGIPRGSTSTDPSRKVVRGISRARTAISPGPQQDIVPPSHPQRPCGSAAASSSARNACSSDPSIQAGCRPVVRACTARLARARADQERRRAGFVVCRRIAVVSGRLAMDRATNQGATPRLELTLP